MLTCPACSATVSTTGFYASVPGRCPACGARAVLDAAGQAVDGRLGWLFGITVIAGGILAGIGLVSPLVAVGAGAAVTVFAVAARPWLIGRSGRLLKFESPAG
jgi:hypothetical protein